MSIEARDCELCGIFDEVTECTECKIKVCGCCFKIDINVCSYCFKAHRGLMDRTVYKCEGYQSCGTEYRFPVSRIPDTFDCIICGLTTSTKTYRFLTWIKAWKE